MEHQKKGNSVKSKKDNSLSGKNVLILGAGLVGEATAIRILKESPQRIILHTLTEDEADIAIENVRKLSGDQTAELVASWGNVLVPAQLMHASRRELATDPSYKNILLDYLYSYLTDDLMEKSALYQLVKKYEPDVIVDSINTATVIGYEDDPYSLPRRILKESDSVKSEEWKNSCLGLLSSSIVPVLVRFVQVLEKTLKDFHVESYIKVSTTGLGGMGVNLLYTHGDLHEPGMSSGILGKVAASGVIHQLFWSLSHTPGINIKVVVPAALIGWQPVAFGKFRSHGKNVPLIDTTKRTKLLAGNVLKTTTCETVNEFMEMPFVDSGENSSYSLREMTAITALGQMECVTREEIAQAVFDSIKGSTRYDLLTAMDYIELGPSFSAAMQRMTVLEKLKTFEVAKKIPSIATNNLGPTVSKHLFELYLLLEVSENSLEKCITTETDVLAKKVEDLIKDSDFVQAVDFKSAISGLISFLDYLLLSCLLEILL